MGERLPEFDQADGGLRYAETGGYRGLWPQGQIDFASLFVCYASIGSHLAFLLCLSAFGVAVRVVVGAGTKPKMRRVDAASNIARMAYHFVDGNRASVSKFPCDTVRFFPLTSVAELSISLVGDRASPVNATIRLRRRMEGQFLRQRDFSRRELLRKSHSQFYQIGALI